MSDAGDLGVLVQIEERALGAQTVPALRFTIVNETHALTPYRQSVLFDWDGTRLRAAAASGLVSVANDSPFVIWLSQFVQTLPNDGKFSRLSLAEAADKDAEQWAEWLPEHLLWAPLLGPAGQPQGMVLYAREQAWDDASLQLVERLHRTYGYCLYHLQARTGRKWGGIRQLAGKRTRWIIAGALLFALLIPVRMSVLAPAEVVALNSKAVAAPQDGVVGSFAVRPNARVKAGDLLFSLDDSSLLNRRQVALKSLEIAKADAHVAQQRAFDDAKSKAEVAVALGRVREKEAELAAVDTQAQRVEIRAEQDGVAIFSDVNDWIGKPVQTGERVMQLARPEDGGILVWLSVSDAINLELEAPVRLFLHTEPLSPRSGRLIETSYQAVLSPEGVASYKLRARFEEGTELPRIGLRGTARLSGDWVLLGYYLFRRPMATVREWTGL